MMEAEPSPWKARLLTLSPSRSVSAKSPSGQNQLSPLQWDLIITLQNPGSLLGLSWKQPVEWSGLWFVLSLLSVNHFTRPCRLQWGWWWLSHLEWQRMVDSALRGLQWWSVCREDPSPPTSPSCRWLCDRDLWHLHLYLHRKETDAIPSQIGSLGDLSTSLVY
jgi:hypothetical protein